jgi:hypothetical protein
MKINKGFLLVAGLGGYWLYSKAKAIVNGLHSKIIRVQIEDFWVNLSRGKYRLTLTWLLENQSTAVVTMHDFKGAFNWRGHQMAAIQVDWANHPIPPGGLQEIPFQIEGRFVDGFAAIILAMHNPGTRLLDGCAVDGTIRGALNRTAFQLPYHQEIVITL